jgi:hypothetical protein
MYAIMGIAQKPFVCWRTCVGSSLLLVIEMPIDLHGKTMLD